MAPFSTDVYYTVAPFKQACRSLGVPGVYWHPQILADQLHNPISNRGDRLGPSNYYWHTQIFRLSDGPERPLPSWTAVKLGKGCCKIVHYLLGELAYWSQKMVHYCQVVPCLAVS